MSDGDKKSDDNRVTLEAPFVKAHFEGKHVSNLLRFLIFLGIALILVLGYFLTLSVQTDHGQIKSGLESLSEAQRETTYVLSIPQEKREELRLTMPDSLRKRTNPR